jgi:superfamily II helicase
VAITDKIYVKNHRQLAAQLETTIPRGAFSGATLDVLFGAEGLEALDEATRDRVLGFAEEFLDCDCETNPYCGHPERKFVQYLLDLRASGLGPDAMVDAMTADYMVYAYPGDLRSFLDDSIRALEAVEELAAVDGHPEAADRARERRRDLQ